MQQALLPRLGVLLLKYVKKNLGVSQTVCGRHNARIESSRSPRYKRGGRSVVGVAVGSDFEPEIIAGHHRAVHSILLRHILTCAC
jgi:hypothetical protein